MTRTLERDMESGEEELACRYAEECARTLLRYYHAEQTCRRRDDPEVENFWREYDRAMQGFQAAFPRYEWTDFVARAVLDEIERTRP